MASFSPELVERVLEAIRSKHYHRERAIAALNASGIAELSLALREAHRCLEAEGRLGLLSTGGERAFHVLDAVLASPIGQ